MSQHSKYLAKKKETHLEIVRKHVEGYSYTQLAKEYDLSTTRIYQILKKYKIKEQEQYIK